MLLNARLILLCLFLATLFSCKASAQDDGYLQYDPDAPELLDIQRTIDASMDDIEDSLKMRGTFKPFATVILSNDSIMDIHVKDNERAYSVADLEEELSIDALKGNYKVVTVFYVYAAPDPSGEKYVAIHAEHTNDDFAYRFEYPFTRISKESVRFEEPRASFEEQIMFKP